ncbi:MAG: tRNA pseudouridine(38-40) synthase TruA [Anaerolineae bacterium]|nr:tRNA pseudouridine(38-40) synthase TruA [Anaerolineae bacterium]MCO5204454.1 tRNA pseudouridine(38-40) synthase TruA [Anaerolineae bacterium]
MTQQRYKALIAYDGTTFKGFQRQVGVPTIQGEIERVVSEIARMPVTITGSGRTDAGVHATGQVISFDLDWQHGQHDLQRAINANLPATIVICDVRQVSAEFHPRFDARRRTYEYSIYNAETRQPLYRLSSWYVRKPLDIEKMSEAARKLVGEHDFATFGQPPQGMNSVRHVYTAEWRRQNQFLVFRITANAFLYRMVRSIVGTLKAVGDGTWQPEQFVAALSGAERRFAGQTAPPHGLVLTAVEYDLDF